MNEDQKLMMRAVKAQEQIHQKEDGKNFTNGSKKHSASEITKRNLGTIITLPE